MDNYKEKRNKIRQFCLICRKVAYTKPLSLSALTPVLIAVAIIDNAKNNVVRSSKVAAAPVTLPVFAAATWSATVGIRLTPTMMVMKPPIIFPRTI